MSPRTILAALGLGAALAASAPADSLWATSGDTPTGWFADTNARQVGDIVTILIKEESKATTDLSQSHSKSTDTSGAVTKLLNVFGIKKPDPTNAAETAAMAGLPEVEWKGSRKHSATAKNESKEALELRVAAVVKERLPNGSLLIEGVREIRHGRDLRLIHIAGMVRPADIDKDNTVLSEHIAQARISYEGRGPAQRVSGKGFFSHLVDFVWPF